MKIKIVYGGRIYTRDTKSRHNSFRLYYRRKQYDRRIGKERWVLLHRKIWEDHYGKIPDTHIIHHIDGDSDNNNISNLECIPLIDHLKKYHRERKANRIGKICVLCGAEYKAKTARSNYCEVCESARVQKFFNSLCLIDMEEI